jgi:hypothetical protein
MRTKGALLLLFACLLACGPQVVPAIKTTPSAPSTPASTPTTGPVATGTAVYLHYYLWWTPDHWQQKLGSSYPYSANPLPLPGTIGADGCGPRVTYSGATIVDIPSEGLYDQNSAATFDRHIQLAAAAGVRGFLADWMGDGTTTQTPTSSADNARLDSLVSRVDAFNAGRANPFALGLAFAAFGNYARPAGQIINDLRYFNSRYGHDPAFANAFSPKPIVMWMDSRKFSLATVQQVSAAVEPSLYLLGDETASSWARDANYLDGSSYYWSTENPYTNTKAGSTVQSLGNQIHAAGKRWFAPVIAGYDKQLVGGSCVPRDGVQTLKTVWQLNAKSRPDGWFGISWNEIVENTYLEPSVAYGSTYLDALKALIGGG